MPARKILVVDDEPDILLLVTHYLKAQGYEVTGARSGLDALAITADRSFDLIILDVLMPDMTGIEVCEELRRRPQTLDVPVILFSALDQDADRARGLAAGANEYVSKPVRLQELKARIGQVLRPDGEGNAAA